MSRRMIRGVVGVAAVTALLLAAAPAQAWLGGARTKAEGREVPVWTVAYTAVMNLWAAVQETLGLRAAAERSVPPGEVTETTTESADDPASTPADRDPNEGVTWGIDPDGAR